MTERHPLDIEDWRVSPVDLEPGDIIAVYSPPSEGGHSYRIHCVSRTFEDTGKVVGVICADGTRVTWDAEWSDFVVSEGPKFVDGYVVRITPADMMHLLEVGLREMDCFGGEEVSE